MGILQGKGIWTLFDDVNLAISVAPLVGANIILCKVSSQGLYDSKTASVVLNSIKSHPGLIPVAWMYSYLKTTVGEAECIKAALEDGFAAVVIDAEADTKNKFAQAENLVERVQAMGLNTSLIYLCGDPRLDTKLKTFPYAALAKICRGGFIPMAYAEMMSSSKKSAAENVICATYDQYERHKAELGYAGPLLPAISACWDNQGKARMSREELTAWCSKLKNYNPPFVSLYRAGVPLPDAWTAFAALPTAVVPGVAAARGVEAQPALVQPSGPGFSLHAYPPATPESGWTGQFTDVEGHLARVRKTSASQTMYATYQPTLPKADKYLIETFIPDHNATARYARYFVVHYENGQRKETEQIVNQYIYNNQWAPLGIYTLDPQNAGAGRVNLVDITADTTPKDLAFTAIRWRVFGGNGPGYDAPVGTEAERASAQLWAGGWVDATPFDTPYGSKQDYHTGADLNLNIPVFDSDRGKPVYAVADGVVTTAQVSYSSWGGLIVIRHSPLADGTPVYSRYGHVENISVRAGDTVTRGQQIATVGYFAAGKNYHLHFDISKTTILEGTPGHWPGTNEAQVLAHYVDPKKFILAHRPS